MPKSTAVRSVAVPTTNGSPSPAVTRSASVLSLLARPEVESLGVSEIARTLRLPKSSIANLLTALEQAGFVRREDAGYTLGHFVLELGNAYLLKIDLLQEFHQLCRTLPHAADETVLIAMRDGIDIVYLGRHDGTQPIRLAADIGSRRPAACTALGKATLAQADLDEVERTYRELGELPIFTEHSHRTVKSLMDDLHRTRERGYAIDAEENLLGVTCYAVALDASSLAEPPRAVSITLLKARDTPELRDGLVADLTELANRLSLHAGTASLTSSAAE